MADVPPPPLLAWTTHPLTERPAAAVAALIAVAALATASGMFGGDWLWGLSALLILGVSLNRFFLPTHGQIHADRLHLDLPLRRVDVSWTDVTAFRVQGRNAWLWTGGHRPLHLMLPRDPERIANAIRARLPASLAPSAGGAANAAPRADGAESASNNNSANNADSGLGAESANSARSTAEVAP